MEKNEKKYIPYHHDSRCTNTNTKKLNLMAKSFLCECYQNQPTAP